MALQFAGQGNLVPVVDDTADALRISPKPTEYTARGHYSLGVFSGIIAAALGANSELFQFRWTDATRLCLIRRVKISASVTTTFFAAGVPVQIDMVKATGWSAQGTGGTGITISTGLKRRTTGMGSSLVAANDIRIATTAALGAGTKTLEGNSIGTLLAGGPITASLNGTIFPPGTPLFEAEVGDGDHPCLLETSEGFVIRGVAVPATGTWQLGVTVEWVECPSY